MHIVKYRSLDESFPKNWRTLWEADPRAGYVNGPQWFISVLQSFKHNQFLNLKKGFSYAI